ncbi:MAG: hypothetical protein U0230_00830 [Polyangiales bacterium]
MKREVRHRYADPLDAVWIAMARGFGLRIERSPEVYAATDGSGSLVLGTDETLDADDCLAQMIFHEMVHSLVQGTENLTVPDWGLDNESDRDFLREHGCLRVQAKLAGEYGLRAVLAPTTDFRAYYDGLPSDPLADDGDPAVAIAREAYARVDQPPWGPWLRRGLEATETVVEATASALADAPPAEEPLPSLYAGFSPRRARG